MRPMNLSLGMASAAIFLAGTASGAASCYTLLPPDRMKCVECTEGGGKQQGTQCVINNRWMSCKTSLEACCDQGEAKASKSQCLKESGDTSLPADYCKYVVSKGAAFGTNVECQSLCTDLQASGIKDPNENSKFVASCLYQHYDVLNGRTVVDGKCYNQWVYGYSESEPSSYKTIKGVESPSACQSHCQQDPECVNFLWTALQKGAKECRLKNKTMVTGALATRFKKPDGSDPVDTKICNYDLGKLCASGVYECNKCDGDPVCVWKSYLHVGGSKYCDDTEACDVPSDDVITTEEATTSSAPYPDIEPPKGQALKAPHRIV